MAIRSDLGVGTPTFRGGMTRRRHGPRVRGPGSGFCVNGSVGRSERTRSCATSSSVGTAHVATSSILAAARAVVTASCGACGTRDSA
jgi:hypothetical protein